MNIHATEYSGVGMPVENLILGLQTVNAS